MFSFPSDVRPFLVVLLLGGPLVAQAAATQAGAFSISLQKRVFKAESKTKSKTLHKMAYFGSLQVGSPSQDFRVVFDTGSGNLIIPGRTCESSACTMHHQFDEQKSPGVKRVNCDGSVVLAGMEPDEITITFGTGSITGQCLTDRICVGNACSTGDFIASTDESVQPFSSFKFDGVLGLALPAMAQGSNFCMMSRLAAEETLHEPLFSVFLSDSDTEKSEITFGEIIHDHMASDLFWVPVTGKAGYWEVGIEDITLDGKRQKLCEDCRVAVDTGTSQLAGPSALMHKLSDALDVKNDCSNFDQLPKLGFIIGGRILSLEPKDYIDRGGLGGTCDVSIMDLDVPPPNGPLFVFGIPFLQKYYTVYDHASQKVGFAVAQHMGETPEALIQIDPSGPKDPSSFLAKRRARPVPGGSSFLSRHNRTAGVAQVQLSPSM